MELLASHGQWEAADVRFEVQAHRHQEPGLDTLSCLIPIAARRPPLTSPQHTTGCPFGLKGHVLDRMGLSLK